MDGYSNTIKLITLFVVSLFVLSSTVIILQDNFDGTEINAENNIPDNQGNDKIYAAGSKNKNPEDRESFSDQDIVDPGRDKDRSIRNDGSEIEKPRRERREPANDNGPHISPSVDSDHDLSAGNPETFNDYGKHEKVERPTQSAMEEKPERPKKSDHNIAPNRDLEITPFEFPEFSAAPKPLGVNVSDPITTQTWDNVTSPYYINSNVTIPFGNTLYIDPDVEVVFNGSYSIFVEGTLYANGTEAEPINFTSNKTSPSAGDWGTIRFNSTGAGRIVYASINFSTNGIEINSSKGIEVANCNISYASIHGVLASKGNFNIHHNIFNTGMYSISVDILYKNSLSITIGSMNINDNEVVGAYGFKFNQLLFDTPLPGTTIIVNDIIISGNTINSTVSTGIYLTKFGVQHMQGGSISWGDLIITNNYMDITADYCIWFDGIFKNLTGVKVNIGQVNISDNNLSTANSGISLDWWTIDQLYGSTSITVDDTRMRDNVIRFSSGGISLNFQPVGRKMFNSSSLTINDFIVDNNNITSSGKGIIIDLKVAGYEMYGSSSFKIRDFFINNNKINNNDFGIDIQFYTSGYFMYGQSRADFGRFLIESNDLTSTSYGINFYSYENGNYMYDNARSTFADLRIVSNEISSGASGSWAIYVVKETTGNYQYDNSKVTISDQIITNNNITSSTGGIYVSPAYIGYFNENNATVSQNDLVVQYNNISSGTNEGIYFYAIYNGNENLDNTIVAIGNISINNNNITSALGGLLFEYFDNGKYMYDNSSFTIGWVDVSINNITNTNSAGIRFERRRNAMYMYESSSAVYGDISFSNNEITSTNSYGIYEFDTENGFYMYDNSSVLAGDLFFNDNTIVSDSEGILFEDIQNIGKDLHENATAEFGNFEVSRNNITSINNYGIYYNDLGPYGTYLYDQSIFKMGDFLMNNNTIRTDMDCIYFQPFNLGYYLYDNSSAVFGLIEINDNYLNNSNGYGITTNPWDNSGSRIYDNATFSIDDCRIINNTIRSYGINEGLYVFLRNSGYMVYDNGRATFGDLLVMENDVFGYTGIAVKIDIQKLGYTVKPFNTATCTAEVTFGEFLINSNTIKTGDKDAIFITSANVGQDIYGDAVITLGNFEINGNTITRAYMDGIEISFISWGKDLHDNAKVYSGHFEINDNNILTLVGAQGIKIVQFTEIGYMLYDNSYFEMGNFEVFNNSIQAGSLDCISISTFTKWGYEMHGTSTAILGDFIFSSNNLSSVSGNGFYTGNQISSFGYYLYDEASVTIGNWLINDNIVKAGNTGIYTENSYFGYSLYGNSSMVMGTFQIINNNINSSGASIYCRGRYYHGSELYENANVTSGDFLIDNNKIDNHGGDALWVQFMYVGYDVLDNSHAVFGDHIITNNDVFSDSVTGAYIDYDNLGSALSTSFFSYCTSSVTFGDILFNNNNITAPNNGYGVYFTVDNSGCDLDGNASVIIGNIENNNNDVIGNSDAFYVGFEYNGYGLHDKSSFELGYLQVNDNTLESKTSYGINNYYFSNLARDMFEQSSFTMGNLEISRNKITSAQVGIYTRDFINDAYNLQDNSRAVFSDFLFNDNNITAGDDGIYVFNFHHLAYTMSGSSYARFGNFSFNNNVIDVPNGDGIIFNNNYQVCYSLTGSAEFVMGYWQFNDNTIRTGSIGIHFEPDLWVNNLYGETSAQLGYYEIKNNYINATSNGIYSFYWEYTADNLYENATVVVGDSIIMYNDIWVYGTQHAIWTGPSDQGNGVYDNSKATFGDYIVSNNDIFTNNSYGIYYSSGYFGNYMTTSVFSNCSASFVMGDMKINNNQITSKYNKGIYVYVRNSAWNMNYWSTVKVGNIEINGNTVDSNGRSLYFDLLEIAKNVNDNSTVVMGSINIDGNTFTSRSEDGIYFWVHGSYKINQDSGIDMDNFGISNNIITAQTYGIDMDFEDSVSANDRSAAGIPGLLIFRNTVKSVAVSAFNLTTTSYPVNRDTDASITWGNIAFAGNDFDGGNHGVAVTWNDPDPFAGQPIVSFGNNLIHDGVVNSTGISLINITLSNIDATIISNFGYGVYVNASNIYRFENSSISSIAITDMYFSMNSSISTLNTTFTKSNVYFKDVNSTLEVAWFMHVKVEHQTGASVPGADVSVKNSDAITRFSGKADGSGRVYFIICYDYRENITGVIKNFNDHTAAATDGVISGTASPNPNMAETKWITITLMDDKLPSLISDNSDNTATTGDPFTFRAVITDNIGVTSAKVVWWFGSDAHTTSILNGIGPYNLTINAPSDRLDTLHYYFNASDFAGNVLSTFPEAVLVIDNDAPTSLDDNSDNVAVYGTDFNLNADGTDNIDVASMQVFWWFDSGSSNNKALTGTGPFNGIIAVPATTVQTLHYYFEERDAAGNLFTGPQIDINITDNAPPEIEIISPSDGALVAGTIKIDVNASDANSGLAFVFVRIGTHEIYNSTPSSTSFSFNFDTKTVSDGKYVLKAAAFDLPGLSAKDSISITIDNTPPTVDAGPDESIEVGETVDFDGSGSKDASGIASYSWTFTYNGTTETLTGEKPNFKFDIVGEYNVTLTVFDIVGNSASDTMLVNVSKPVIPEPQRPWVLTTSPSNEDTDVPVDTKVIITFDIPMNESVTEDELSISPSVIYTLSWNGDKTVLTITFVGNLTYNTTYTITIGDAVATTGGLLHDAPVVFKFTTEKEKITPKPTITIEPLSNVETGDTITVSGSSTGYDEGTEVTVTLNGESVTGKIGSDGKWAIDIKAPDTEGVYTVTVTIDGEADSTDITILKTPEPPKPEPKEPEEDKGLFGLKKTGGIDTFLLLIIIIIVILIALVAVSRRKKPEEESEDREDEEEMEE